MKDRVFKTTIIGVAGASGSGKTTLADGLSAHLRQVHPDRAVACISLDCYYHDLSQLSFTERDQTNFDHPDAIEFDLINEHLTRLDQQLPITIPDYDFSQHSRRDGGTVLDPPSILILEGLLLGANDTLLKRIDHLIFVETDLEICLSRRIARDVAERGRSERSVREFWSQRVAPMFEQYGAPLANVANTRINGECQVQTMVAQAAQAIMNEL